MKKDIQIFLLMLSLMFAVDVSAQEKAIDQSTRNAKTEVNKADINAANARGQRPVTTKHAQSAKNTQAKKAPKTTVIYSNRIEHSSSKKLTHVAKKSSMSKIAQKATPKQVQKATPQMIQVKKWQEQLEESKRFVDEIKGKDIEEGSELQLQFKKHQEEISKMETKIAKQYSLIQMKQNN